MAYKYKLVKELGPQDFKQAAKIAGPDTMDAISKGHLNDYDLNDLEQILGQAGVEQEKIYQIVNLWMNRHKDVGLNEKEEGYYKDPKTGEIKKGSLQTSLDALTQRFKDEEEQGKENLTKEVLRRLKNR
jgi:hypothetical protein